MNLIYVNKEEEIAKNLKFIRECRELSQREIANKLGIERSTYTYYELEKTQPNIFTLIKISKILKVSLIYLVTKNGAMEARKIMSMQPEPEVKSYNYLKSTKSFARKLRTIRKESRLTQQCVANKLNLGRSTYTQYECGKSLPTVLTILKIIEIFKININDFLTY